MNDLNDGCKLEGLNKKSCLHSEQNNEVQNLEPIRFSQF